MLTAASGGWRDDLDAVTVDVDYEDGRDFQVLRARRVPRGPDRRESGARAAAAQPRLGLEGRPDRDHDVLRVARARRGHDVGDRDPARSATRDRPDSMHE